MKFLVLLLLGYIPFSQSQIFKDGHSPTSSNFIGDSDQSLKFMTVNRSSTSKRDLRSRALATTNATTCTGSVAGEVFTRFTSIFFGDFITKNAQDILGPLAVAGKFAASSYTVNSNHGSGKCANLNSTFATYGLIVGTEYAATDVHVHGAAYLPAGTNTSRTYITMLDSGCTAYTNLTTGLLYFQQAYTNAQYNQIYYSGLQPSIQLDSNGKLTKVGAPVGGFDIMTFNTCNNQNCPLYPGYLSVPTAMLFGQGNWNGPQGMTFPNKLIINVPVDVGSSITLYGNQPTLGLTPCSTVWNFYPSDKYGSYSPGKITIYRNTGGQVGGLFLSPNANIYDYQNGAFAGIIIANNYQWSGSGIEIHDYKAVGGQCDGFSGCFPIYNSTQPDYPSPPMAELFTPPKLLGITISSSEVTTSQSTTASSGVTTSQSTTASSGVTTSQSITASSEVTTSQSITASSEVTTSQSITASSGVTTSQSITASSGVTTSQSITASSEVTTSQSTTASSGVTTSQSTTASSEVTTSQSTTASYSNTISESSTGSSGDLSSYSSSEISSESTSESTTESSSESSIDSSSDESSSNSSSEESSSDSSTDESSSGSSSEESSSDSSSEESSSNSSSGESSSNSSFEESSSDSSTDESSSETSSEESSSDSSSDESSSDSTSEESSNDSTSDENSSDGSSEESSSDGSSEESSSSISTKEISSDSSFEDSSSDSSSEESSRDSSSEESNSGSPSKEISSDGSFEESGSDSSTEKSSSDSSSEESSSNSSSSEINFSFPPTSPIITSTYTFPITEELSRLENEGIETISGYECPCSTFGTTHEERDRCRHEEDPQEHHIHAKFDDKERDSSFHDEKYEHDRQEQNYWEDKSFNPNRNSKDIMISIFVLDQTIKAMNTNPETSVSSTRSIQKATNLTAQNRAKSDGIFNINYLNCIYRDIIIGLASFILYSNF